MSTLLLQPQISINSDGRLNGAFLTFFSKAATEERFVAVRECRWQANRIIEEAPKLYKDSDYYIKMNKTCLSCPYQPRAFLTPKGKNKMEDHSLFARYLEYSANYVLTKFCWIFVTFSLSFRIRRVSNTHWYSWWTVLLIIFSQGRFHSRKSIFLFSVLGCITWGIQKLSKQRKDSNSCLAQIPSSTENSVFERRRNHSCIAVMQGKLVNGCVPKHAVNYTR